MSINIEKRRECFYSQLLSSFQGYEQDIRYISKFVKSYKTELIKKIETYMIPSIALLIFRKKQLHYQNIYDAYFTAPYTDLLNALQESLILDLVSSHIGSFIRITRNSIEKAFADLSMLKFINKLV